MYVCLHVKHPLILSDFNATSNFSDRFKKKHSNVQFQENPSGGSRAVQCELTDTPHTHMTKLIVAFRKFAYGAKNRQHNIP